MNIKFTPNSVVVAAAGAGFACSWAAHGGTTTMSAPYNSSSSCSRVVCEPSKPRSQTSLEALLFQPATRSGLSWAEHAPGMKTLGRYGVVSQVAACIFFIKSDGSNSSLF